LNGANVVGAMAVRSRSLGVHHTDGVLVDAEHESHAQVWVGVDDRLQLGVCPHITGFGGHVA